MLIHRTHQNGLSVDFMIPKIKDEQPYRRLDRIGMWHYLLKFDEGGKSAIAPDVSLDFESMAKHILALDEACKNSGVFIRKIILNTHLYDEFFATEAGQIIKSSDIYFVQSLTPLLNDLHDEHYHVDFHL